MAVEKWIVKEEVERVRRDRAKALEDVNTGEKLKTVHRVGRYGHEEREEMAGESTRWQ